MALVICPFCEEGEDLILVQTIIGRILIGMRSDGRPMPDGPPEYYGVDKLPEKTLIFCLACCEVVTPDVLANPSPEYERVIVAAQSLIDHDAFLYRVTKERTGEAVLTCTSCGAFGDFAQQIVHQDGCEIVPLIGALLALRKPSS